MNLFNSSPVDKLNEGADGPPPVGCGAPGGGGCVGSITGIGTVLVLAAGFRSVPAVDPGSAADLGGDDTCAGGVFCVVPLISTVVN